MNILQNKESLTFGEWLDFWLEFYKKPFLTSLSLRNIEQILRLHTPKELKEKKLRELTVVDIDRALSAIPASRTYIYTRQTWHNALKKACCVGLIDRNPVELCDKIRYKKILQEH